MFTAEDKLAELLREIKIRERFYPGQIDVGILSPELAAKRIAIMKEIAEEYERLAQGERLL